MPSNEICLLADIAWPPAPSCLARNPAFPPFAMPFRHSSQSKRQGRLLESFRKLRTNRRSPFVRLSATRNEVKLRLQRYVCRQGYYRDVRLDVGVFLITL